MLNREQRRELLDIFTSLIRIDSSNPPGNEAAAAAYIASLLEGEGIAVRLLQKAPDRVNVYAEIGQGDRPPVLLLSHIDVVPPAGGWDYPAFEAVRENGRIYGRGAIDTKHLTAMEIACMLWLKRSGVPLDRRIILLATADEEAGSGYGMGFLAEEHPELLPSGCVISEGGGFVMEQAGQRLRTCTCGEKGRCSISVEPTQAPAGPEVWSTPTGRLLRAMAAIAAYEPEPRLTEPTRAFWDIVGGRFEDPTVKNLWEYATKSCLAIDAYEMEFAAGGPQKPLSLSYQYIDGTTRQEVEELLASLLGDQEVRYEIGPLSEGYTCSLESPFFRELCRASRELDPETRVLPMIALGRTDGRFIRRNVYGYSPLLADVPFSQVLKMVHGPNEHITEASLYFGAEVIYRALLGTVGAPAAGQGSSQEMEECSND